MTGQPKVDKHFGYLLTGECQNCGGTGVESETRVLGLYVLKILTEKQRFVVERRLGLIDGRRYSQREVSEMMGVERSTVAKLEERGRKRILDLVKTSQKTSPSHY